MSNLSNARTSLENILFPLSAYFSIPLLFFGLGWLHIASIVIEGSMPSDIVTVFVFIMMFVGGKLESKLLPSKKDHENILLLIFGPSMFYFVGILTGGGVISQHPILIITAFPLVAVGMIVKTKYTLKYFRQRA